MPHADPMEWAKAAVFAIKGGGWALIALAYFFIASKYGWPWQQRKKGD